MKIFDSKFVRKDLIAVMMIILGGFVFAQTDTPAEAKKDAPAGSAENPIVLSCDKAVEYALEHGSAIKTAKLDLELSKFKKNTSWNSLIPSVNVNETISRSNEVSTQMEQIIKMINPMYKAPEPTESKHWTAVGNIAVQFNFNAAMIANIISAVENYETGKITWQQTLQETESNVRKLFYALLLQQESLKISRSSLENARQRQNQAAVNYRNGYVPELSLLQAQVAYSNLLPQVTKAEQEFKQQLDTFVFLLGLPVGTQIVLDGKIEPEFVDLNADELVQECLRESLSLRQLDSTIKSIKIQKTALDLKDYTPSISVNWGWQPMITDALDKSWTDKDNWSDNGNLSFTLAWNITNMLPWSSSRVTAKELKTNVAKMEINRDTLVQNLELEVRKAVDSLNLSRSSIESSQKSIALAQRSYNMTWQAYRSGTKELLDLRDAESQLNQAKLGLLSEQFNYMTKLWDLENQINRKLTGNNKAGENNEKSN